MKIIQDVSKGKVYYLMKDNHLPARIDDIFKTKECTLNPGKIISRDEDDTYYILRFYYSSYTDTFKINPDNKMIISLDSRVMELDVRSINYNNNEVVAYYPISVLDIIEIGTANEVKISVSGVSETIEREFNSQNFLNFKNFTNRYIYASKDTENLSITEATKKLKMRGFVNVGAGSGYELWISYLINFLNIKQIPNLGDFISLGVGYTQFKYDRYVLSQYSTEPPPIFYYDYFDSNDNDVWYINAMYGLTYPIELINCSVELGITASYYNISDTNWDEHIDFETHWGTVPLYNYEITDGEPYEGFTIGTFVQFSIFWFRLNTEGAWAAGVSIPVRF